MALGKPSGLDRNSWDFKRYVVSLPATQEMVIMSRSWYNRAGVEKVMGFCIPEEHEEFMRSALPFERMLVRSGTQIFKYYLDVSKSEQNKRLADRRVDPLKQWKINPIDKSALRRRDDYSSARNDMFTRTHSEDLPWHVVRADDKKQARLNVIRHLMARVDCPGHGGPGLVANTCLEGSYSEFYPDISQDTLGMKSCSSSFPFPAAFQVTSRLKHRVPSTKAVNSGIACHMLAVPPSTIPTF